MWAGAKFQMARIPPVTIRSATDCAAAAGVAITPSRVCVRRTKSGQEHERLDFRAVNPLADLLAGRYRRPRRSPSRGSGTSHTPAKRCPNCRRRRGRPLWGGSSRESSRSSGPGRPADSRLSVCRRFRSFRYLYELGWGPGPARVPGRRRKPGRHRRSSSAGGCGSISAGGGGWLREFRGRGYGTGGLHIEKLLSRKSSRFQVYSSRGLVSSY